jgi:hypothetical protein
MATTKATSGVIDGGLTVAQGGTGVSTLTDGGVLLGSGTQSVTAMAILADGEIIVGDGTTDPVAESGATARTSLGAAALGANSDITSITGLTTDLTVAQGGTGAGTHTANNVLVGAGTGAISSVAPSTSGNVLTSDGTVWASAAALSYETGSFTPVLVAASGSGTILYSQQSGRYIKVGSLCYLSVRLTTTSLSSRTGNLSIGGLPFTASGTNSADAAVGSAAGLNAPAAAFFISGHCGNAGTTITLNIWKSATTAGTLVLQHSEWSDDGSITLNIIIAV